MQGECPQRVVVNVGSVPKVVRGLGKGRRSAGQGAFKRGRECPYRGEKRGMVCS